jgi:hypothetical protein
MTQDTLMDRQAECVEATRKMLGIGLGQMNTVRALCDWALGASPAKAADCWEVSRDAFANIIAKTSRAAVRRHVARAGVDLYDVPRLAMGSMRTVSCE